MGTSKPSQALALRLHQAGIVARMTLKIITLMQGEYNRKHIGAVMVEMLAAVVIRINDVEGGKPLSNSEISKRLGIPRTTIRMATLSLLKMGVVRQVGLRFTGDLDYLAARIEAPYWLGLVEAITTAADELRAGDEDTNRGRLVAVSDWCQKPP